MEKVIQSFNDFEKFVAIAGNEELKSEQVNAEQILGNTAVKCPEQYQEWLRKLRMKYAKQNGHKFNQFGQEIF